MIPVPTTPAAHLAFDLAAWIGGGALSIGLYCWRLKATTRRIAETVDGRYFAALVVGAIGGAWILGSLNSLRGPVPSLSHSVVGALAGAIFAVEVYKALRGIKGSTGGLFVGSFALGIVIGRLGCFFAGLPDRTFGTPTNLPWAVNLGDGIGRHPVQLYEALAMGVLLAAYLRGLALSRPWALRRGFYALCIAYGAQRFVWEFLKPYPRLIGPFNLFHVVCAGLVVYGWIYYVADRRQERRSQSGAVSVSGPDHEPV